MTSLRRLLPMAGFSILRLWWRMSALLVSVGVRPELTLCTRLVARHLRATASEATSFKSLQPQQKIAPRRGVIWQESSGAFSLKASQRHAHQMPVVLPLPGHRTLAWMACRAFLFSHCRHHSLAENERLTDAERIRLRESRGRGHLGRLPATVGAVAIDLEGDSSEEELLFYLDDFL